MLREATIANNNSVGTSSWWKVVIATYKPGSKSVTNIASSLTNLSKLVYWNFKFLSSAEDKKSIKTAGAIKAYGVPIY